MKKAIIAGNLIVDTIKRVERYPQRNLLTTITEISRSVGGCVPNVAIDLKRLSPETEVFAAGRVGADENGAFLIDTLRSCGVDTCGVITDESLKTSFADVMTEPTGERTFFQYRGASSALSGEDFNVNEMDADIFHIGYALLLDTLDGADEMYGTKLARLLHAVQSRGIETSLDVVSESSERFRRIVTPSLKFCDSVIFNETEAGEITGIPPRDERGGILPENIGKILERLLELGVKKRAVVHCPELGAMLRANGNAVIIPSLDLPKGYICGSVGAGDAFCSGILYATLYGADDEEALRIASCCAAANLAVADSVSGAGPLDSVMKLEKLYGRKTL